ncbi:hypothetical protein TEA_028632 [Camellia sinensis var. sinensis]|uniref:Uncharacterized protein n=1 Tax=Camellia sinensis var. sinensis TaxID=542762 RepID=A0A4S4F0C2_CAMSN|nr:hypothetical protein TEA_028632 [Camellia sinensis var. sinensis]
MFSAANLVVANAAKAEGAASVYTLADGSVGDWFGGFLYSAGQQANEVVQDQLSALSFTSLAVIFGAGLVTSLSPCTLSVVFYHWPLVILELLAQRKAKERSLGTRLHFHWDWLLRWPSLIIELQLPSFFNNFDPRAAAANFPSDVQAYLAGLTFALVALPCSTPVLATLLGYIAASKDLLLQTSIL